MSGPLEVAVVSAERSIWSGSAKSVVAKTPEGDVGILRGHEPMPGPSWSKRRCGSSSKTAARFSWLYTAGFSRSTAIKLTLSPSPLNWHKMLILNERKRPLGELKLRLNHQIFPRSVVLRPGSRSARPSYHLPLTRTFNYCWLVPPGFHRTSP